LILGIGVDIMATNRLPLESLKEDDPFFQRAFSEKEREQGKARADAVLYFASRFAAKEAVFKAFRLHPNEGKFQEIEIVNDGNGAPYVNLYGHMREVAIGLGNPRLHLSLSQEKEYTAAFAVLETDAEGKNKEVNDELN